MSLLYECINGIIQGGILDSGDDGEEIASLCVSKLRSMIMVEGDPNCKLLNHLSFHQLTLPSEIRCASGLQ
jgi:AP-3 complex subunit delta-1